MVRECERGHERDERTMSRPAGVWRLLGLIFADPITSSLPLFEKEGRKERKPGRKREGGRERPLTSTTASGNLYEIAD